MKREQTKADTLLCTVGFTGNETELRHTHPSSYAERCRHRTLIHSPSDFINLRWTFCSLLGVPQSPPTPIDPILSLGSDNLRILHRLGYENFMADHYAFTILQLYAIKANPIWSIHFICLKNGSVTNGMR